MSQATKEKYEYNELLQNNTRYHKEHTLTHEDVDAVSSMIVHIESSRFKTKPKPPDLNSFHRPARKTVQQ